MGTEDAKDHAIAAAESIGHDLLSFLRETAERASEEQPFATYFVGIVGFLAFVAMICNAAIRIMTLDRARAQRASFQATRRESWAPSPSPKSKRVGPAPKLSGTTQRNEERPS